MTENQIGRLLADLWVDLQQPGILLQAGVLALCLLAAWWLARFLHWRVSDDSAQALKRGAAAYRRMLFPLLAVLLLLLGRAVLGHWRSTHLLSVAIPLLGAMAVIRVAVYMLRLGFSQAAWLEAFERSIAAVVWAAAAMYLTGLLPDVVAWLSEVKLTMGKNSLTLWTLLSAVFWVGLTVLVAIWAGGALEARLMRTEGLHSSLRVVFARLGKALLLLGAVLVVLPLLGVDLTVLSVFGGALGVGLGFGLQKIASNYLSGFIILLDRSIRIGDVITVDGQNGVVTRITTRYVVVRSLAGVEAIIPNDTLVTTTVLNHSYTDKKVRVAVTVAVAEPADVPRAIALMAAIPARHGRVLADPAPVAQVLNVPDYGVELELGFWISDPENGTQNVRSDVLVEVMSAFRAQGIGIPFPRRDVTLLQGTKAQVPGNARE